MKPKFYKVVNVPVAFSGIYSFEKELYFPRESVGLNKSDVITMVLEFKGKALIGGEKDGLSGIYVSEKTIRKALVEKLINYSDDFSLEQFDEVIELVRSKIASSNN